MDTQLQTIKRACLSGDESALEAYGIALYRTKMVWLAHIIPSAVTHLVVLRPNKQMPISSGCGAISVSLATFATSQLERLNGLSFFNFENKDKIVLKGKRWCKHIGCVELRGFYKLS